MKTKAEILSINLSDYRIVEWEKTPLFNNNRRLNSYISANLGTRFNGFFASAKVIEGNTEIKWYSKIVGLKPKSLSSLEGEEYIQYKKIYENKISGLNELIEKIESEGQNKRWAQMLRDALKNTNENFVFC